MKPYYQDDHVTLYHGDSLTDCREWLTADVLVTDPPYGTEKTIGYGRRATNGPTADGRTSKHGVRIANDTTTDARDNALKAWGDRPAVVFGSPRLPEPPGGWADRLVWDKKRPGMNGGPFRYNHEAIYARGMVRTNNSTFSVFSIYPDQTDHIHAKPVALMETLVGTCPDGIIADPFAGGGCHLVGL
jgi:hypothetical protein